MKSKVNESSSQNNCNDLGANSNLASLGFGDWISPAFGYAVSHRILTADSSAVRRPSSISRDDIKNVCVVGQAHNKFVVCVRYGSNLQGPGMDVCGPMVLLLDQHAADERIRLEAMEDLLLRPSRARLSEGDDAASCINADGNCSLTMTVSKRQSREGVSDVSVTRIGRNGREVWEIVSTQLRPPVPLNGLEPGQLRQLNRFRFTLEAWGFQVSEDG
jgi:hypothetical protein